MDLCGTELHDTPSHRLDAWIAQNLLPDEEFRVQYREAKGTVAELLEWCFREEDTVLKVVKAGSSAKGTALRNGSDADLVVFLGSFKSFRDMHIGHSDVIEEIHQMLNIHRQSIAKDIDIKDPKQHLDALGQPIPPRALSFSFRSRKVEKSISVDIVPAYKALGNIPSYVKPDPEVYVSLIRARGRPGEFSACFTKLQNNFVKPLPDKLKNLIRLVKHWYKQIVKPKYQATLPPMYALELLTIYAWEQGCGAEDFRTDEGFCAVLQLLCQHQNLCIYWTTNYDFENPIVADFLRRQLRMPRPVILDPADPTGVLGQGASWDLVAEEAEESLQSPCCINFVEPIQAWDVQPEVPIPRYDKEIFVKNPDGKTYTYQVRGKTSVLDLKRRIQKKARISVEQQSLIYNRKELQDENTLRYYRIPYEATLFVRITED